MHGCDSIVNLDLTVIAVDASVSQSDNTLTANTAGASYQWLNCDDGFSIVTGETNQSYTATESGNFAVEVTLDFCVDTSECHEISIASIIENNFGSDLRFYPNPTSGHINCDLGDFHQDINVTIKNWTGQVVSIAEFNLASIFSFEVEGPTGLYIVEIHTPDGKKAILKVVKQ